MTASLSLPVIVPGIETPALILAAMVATLQDQLLPQLTDASARAAAASMVQVLAQLSVTVAWDPAPLAERLRVRRAALRSLPLDPAGDRIALSAEANTGDAVALERAIHACDAFVSALVPSWPQMALTDALAPPLERWLLDYGRQAAEVDLRFMAPSHLGKLTRKAVPKAQPGDSK